MKAYKIKIVLEESNPLIWRRVIVPEEITFKRLHDIIQISMGWGNVYLYDFNIIEEKLRITGDEEVIEEYEMYSKMKLTKKNDPYGFIEKMLEIEPKLSSKVKIDKYLQKGETIQYIYDFGDYWKHDLILEEIIENYEGDCPVCTDGEGACPPNDVGGIMEYEVFLEIIKDKNHPDYEQTKKWADEQHYVDTFDIEKANIHMEEIFKPQRIESKII